jgi:hypothetical protein
MPTFTDCVSSSTTFNSITDCHGDTQKVCENVNILKIGVAPLIVFRNGMITFVSDIFVFPQTIYIMQ